MKSLLGTLLITFFLTYLAMPVSSQGDGDDEPAFMGEEDEEDPSAGGGDMKRFEGLDMSNYPEEGDHVVANIENGDFLPFESFYELAQEFCPSRGSRFDNNPFTSCIPKSRRCRRIVLDDLVSEEEVTTIRTMFESILKHYSKGVRGPAQLVDLNKGIISYQDSFADLHKILAMTVGKLQKQAKAEVEKEFAGKEDATPKQKYEAQLVKAKALMNRAIGPLDRLSVYHDVVERIHMMITVYYLHERGGDGMSGEEIKEFYEQKKHVLRVAQPTFFSRLEGGKEAKSVNDEYWHEHVDTDQYGSFAVTTLLYLNHQDPASVETAEKKDSDNNAEQQEEKQLPSGGFTGGSFLFGGPYNATVHPRAGRLSAFSSGMENPHRVEKVTQGVRFALTSAFTCSDRPEIAHPITEEVLKASLPPKDVGADPGAVRSFLSYVKDLIGSVQDPGDLPPYFTQAGAKGFGQDEL